jgi:hypothetical protein
MVRAFKSSADVGQPRNIPTLPLTPPPYSLSLSHLPHLSLPLTLRFFPLPPCILPLLPPPPGQWPFICKPAPVPTGTGEYLMLCFTSADAVRSRDIIFRALSRCFVAGTRLLVVRSLCHRYLMTVYQVLPPPSRFSNPFPSPPSIASATATSTCQWPFICKPAPVPTGTGEYLMFCLASADAVRSRDVNFGTLSRCFVAATRLSFMRSLRCRYLMNVYQVPPAVFRQMPDTFSRWNLTPPRRKNPNTVATTPCGRPPLISQSLACRFYDCE